MDRVCVIGAGAIGSLLAARLCGTAETWMLVRRAEQARAIECEGLIVSGKGSLTSRPRATVDPGVLPDCDFVIVATKATDLDAAAGRLKSQLPLATVVTMQDGLGAEEIVASHGDWPLVSGTTSMRSVRHHDTHVECQFLGSTWLGPWAPTETPFERAEAIQKLLVAAGLDARAVRDIQAARWSKLVFDAVVSTVSALTGVPHSRAMVDGGLAELTRSAIGEGRAIAAAAGIALIHDPWELNVRAVTRRNAPNAVHSHAPSMQRDIKHRQPTEVEFCAGALVREAERLGVDAPLIATLYRLVLARESSWAQPQPPRPPTSMVGGRGGG